MKITNYIKQTIIASAMLLPALVIGATAHAIPYQQDANVGTTYPAFNVFTGTPSEGDESDFFRGKEETSTSPSTTNVTSACNDGARFTLRVYVHNGAQPALNQNGSGPGVAHGTKVRVQLPSNTESSNFGLSSVISATNATSVSDGMNISCGGKVVKMSYVSGTARQFSTPGGTQALSDSIVTSGAPVGTNTPNGDMWGCWDQRVWVTLTVVVKEQTPPPPVSEGVCKAVSVTADQKDRSVNVSVSETLNNATVIGYKIDFGDGTISNQQTDSHKYTKDGTYVITASVQIKFADGHTEWKTAQSCMKQVTFKEDQPPVVVPPTTPPATPVTPSALPNTGPGSVAMIFLAVSAASTAGYYAFTRKFHSL